MALQELELVSPHPTLDHPDSWSAMTRDALAVRENTHECKWMPGCPVCPGGACFLEAATEAFALWHCGTVAPLFLAVFRRGVLDRGPSRVPCRWVVAAS